MDYRHKPPHRGVNFGRRSGVNIQRRLTAFESAEAYLKSDAGNRMSCLILDVRMPGLGGLELQQLLTDQGRPVPIIFITSFPSGRVRRQAIKGGAICYLPKPNSDDELLRCIRLAFKTSEPTGH